MYGIFTYIYHKNPPNVGFMANVGKYTIRTMNQPFWNQPKNAFDRPQ